MIARKHITTKSTEMKVKKGFTLIEAMLYIAIISTLVLMASSFLFLILGSRAKSQAILEVESQGESVMSQITQSVRNSENVLLPVQGASGQSLTLESSDSSKNPTVFNSSGTDIQVKEGTSPVIDLTSSQVSVSNLSFRNISRGGTPGTVRIEFTVSYTSDSQAGEFNYSKTFYGSASLR